jgi:hypothetical protein
MPKTPPRKTKPVSPGERVVRGLQVALRARPVTEIPLWWPHDKATKEPLEVYLDGFSGWSTLPGDTIALTDVTLVIDDWLSHYKKRGRKWKFRITTDD